MLLDMEKLNKEIREVRRKVQGANKKKTKIILLTSCMITLITLMTLMTLISLIYSVSLIYLKKDLEVFYAKATAALFSRANGQFARFQVVSSQQRPDQEDLVRRDLSCSDLIFKQQGC